MPDEGYRGRVRPSWRPLLAGFLGKPGESRSSPGKVPPGSLTLPRGLRRENAENMYYFSELALTLNEQEDGVAPTDSRLRPDQRLMEKGRWDEANTEKQRLEEKQRLNRRRRMETCAAGCGGEDGEPRAARGGGSGVGRDDPLGEG